MLSQLQGRESLVMAQTSTNHPALIYWRQWNNTENRRLMMEGKQQKEKGARVKVWKVDREVTGGHATEAPCAWIHNGRTRCKPQSLVSPPSAPAGWHRVCCNLWFCLRKAVMKRTEAIPGPQQERLDDLGEGPQPGTLGMCAPVTALFAGGAHVRAPTNCSCLRAQVHV